MKVKRAYFRFPTTSHPIIDLTNVDLSWVGIATLSGPSGSGKTTLFRLLAAWYDSPQDVCVLEPTIDRYRDVRFIGAHESLVPWKSVMANMTYRGMSADDARSVLQEFALPDTIGRQPVYELSYGMYKRVELAIAIAEKPALLLLDEFFSSLDDDTKALIRKYLVVHRPDLQTWVIAHERAVRQWLGHQQFALVLDEATRCVVDIEPSH
jgi:ABC-type nitrate/sulfonate/bicarbonate transport system ATPase subunit